MSGVESAKTKSNPDMETIAPFQALQERLDFRGGFGSAKLERQNPTVFVHHFEHRRKRSMLSALGVLQDDVAGKSVMVIESDCFTGQAGHELLPKLRAVFLQ